MGNLSIDVIEYCIIPYLEFNYTIKIMRINKNILKIIYKIYGKNIKKLKKIFYSNKYPTINDFFHDDKLFSYEIEILNDFVTYTRVLIKKLLF